MISIVILYDLNGSISLIINSLIYGTLKTLKELVIDLAYIVLFYKYVEAARRK